MTRPLSTSQGDGTSSAARRAPGVPLLDGRADDGASTAETSATGQAIEGLRQGRTPLVAAPAVSLPKGGGAIRGLGEKFGTNPVNGTGTLTIPIATSPGRAGFAPQLSLSYDSGAGNGPFGFGWSLGLPAIVRKTDRGLPLYLDARESDVFMLAGAEDLVPVLTPSDTGWIVSDTRRTVGGVDFEIRRYQPRLEGAFARIERWTNRGDAADVSWRTLSAANVTTWYGRTANSRIADPEQPARIFSWLICETWDDRGNAARYDYQEENGDGVDRAALHERNRTDAVRATNRYVKRVRHGNRRPHLPDGDPRAPLPSDWLFETVFDYGTFAVDPAHAADEVTVWPARPDPFSTCRAGFEVRTYRLCRRVLTFHHFAQELGAADVLVRSTDFTYDWDAQAFSRLRMVTQSGYVRQGDGSYLRRSMPPLEFEYSQPVIGDRLGDVDAASLERLPAGVGDGRSRFLDLDGDGLAGILSEDAGALYYAPNLSAASAYAADTLVPAAVFGPSHAVVTSPSLSGPGGTRQWLDLAADGQLDLADFAGPVPGFHERTADAVDWESFRTFTSLPAIDWASPHLRFVDLTGDGLADLLITDDDALVWHPSLGEAGFGEAERVWHALDDERGPRVLLSNGVESIHLADMTGDGSADIVRIRNGEVSYWPNLGYGRFGARVTMDAAPWFDHPDTFDHRRLRLADIDGSGLIDLIYLGGDGVDLYFNHSGNRWSAARRLTSFPPIADAATIEVVDLFGNGTACLVWSTPLAEGAGRQMRYVDLMGGQKPHLLVKAVNNLGAETFIHYAPSTRFYLDDRIAGRPWVTRLPFPVHVVERIETRDRISGNRFVTRFAYHDGCFDGGEREFRGFGLVEQWDTETLPSVSPAADVEEASGDAANLDPSSHVPPRLTRTWFHTGTDLHDDLLPDVLSGDLSADEAYEARRALRGSMLRQETYAVDGSDREQQPYSTIERTFTVRRVQPRAINRHAVFMTQPRETVTSYFERQANDPRVTHTFALAFDDFGNILQSATVGYGRRAPDPRLSAEDQAIQGRLLATCGEHTFTNAIALADTHRVPVASSSRAYELSGIRLAAGQTRITFEAMRDAVAAAVTIGFTAAADERSIEKRLVAHQRTLYRPDDLGASRGNAQALLPLGQLESLALPGESYTLAFTGDILSSSLGGRVTAAMLADDGGYVRLDDQGDAGDDGDDEWWTPSGRTFFSPASSADPIDELAEARAHFFLPRRTRDPFHRSGFETESEVTYDDHDLFVVETRDALNNIATFEHDYRVQQPRLSRDANGNRGQIVFDALGQVVGSATMGKEGDDEGGGEGDSLDGFVPDLDDAAIQQLSVDPFGAAAGLLRQATTRLVYDLFAYQRTRDLAQPQPAVVCTLAREMHQQDLPGGAASRLLVNFSYSDGFGREIQKKMQAEAGPVNGAGAVVAPRWVGTGWTIFNNKGLTVRQYEPFFTASHAFESESINGVSPILFYDPLGRTAATLHPNHTWDKVVFDAWRRESWDVNDTVLIADPAADDHVGGYWRRLSPDTYLPGWHAARAGGTLGGGEQAAAIKTAQHAATPGVAHLDALGRTFLTIAHNRAAPADTSGDGASGNALPIDTFHETRVTHDTSAQPRQIVDALGRVAARFDYDLTGSLIHSISMDAGERWTLADVAGQVRYTWNSRQHQVQSAYDVLRRPTDTMVTDESGRQRIVVRIDYGESHADAAARNLRGRSYRTCDASGVIIAEAYDFKGNLTRSTRQLAADYRETLDWSAPVALETDIFTSSTTFDALNRPVTLTMPDGSIIRPSYNEARLPEAIDVNIRGEMADGQPVWSPAVLGIDYNAKGQRVRLALGNGAVTTCEHDPLTFRLIRLDTSRDGRRFQDLHYTYDPAGNVISVEDRAQPEIFFRNTAVGARGDYLYDAIYQLIEATGREHLGQQAGPAAPPRAPAAFDGWHTNLPQPGDGQAMGRYTERYAYDRSGNLLSIRHLGSDPTQSGWTRSYEYAEPGAIDPAGVIAGNRLTSSRVGEDEIERLTYDPHGNMTSMGHLPLMQWNFADQLIATASQVVTAGTPEITWYVYDASGQRVRKITDRQTGAGGTPTRRSERIYLGGLEIHREYGVDGVRVDLERETLHVMDGAQRLALIETRTRGDDGSPRQLLRYQFGNHLDSASLELSGEGEVISYEEYYPYGASSYQAVSAGINAVAKRYRYGAKERDEETGLSYFGLRYHAGWLGRWTAADPAGIGDGLNLYRSHANNPIRFTDPDGGAILDQLSNIAYGVGGGIASKASGVWEGATALGAAAYNDPVGLGTTMLKESLPGKVLTGNFSGAFTDVKEEVGYALGNAGNLVIAPYLARQYAGTLATGSQAEIQAATEKGIDDVAGMIDTGSDIVSFGVKAGVKIAAKKGIIEGVSVALAAAVVSVPDAPPPRRQLSFALDRPEGPTRFDVHPIGTVAEHPVVVVTSGDTAQAFYKRSGEGSKGTAKEGLSGADAARPMGAVVDDWAPFDGWTIKEEWFNKTRFNTENVRDYFDVEIPLPLDRWGSFLNYRVNEALLGMEAEFLPQLKQMTTAAATEAFSTHGLSLPPLQTKMQAAMEALRAGHSLDWARRE